jgi:glycosyltransferase involved in cell wall biosynthesis
MALGIPTVATRIGANTRIIRNGENGFLVNDPGEWKAAILELAADPELRRRVGLGARTVVERFSVRANQEAYLKVLVEVFRREKSADREGEA